MNKKDLRNALITGFTTGLIAWRVLSYLGATIPIFPLWALALIIPFLWVAGVRLGYFLANFFEPFRQFGKFVAIGFTNAAVDFGTFNLLFSISGENGALYAYLNAISF